MQANVEVFLWAEKAKRLRRVSDVGQALRAKAVASVRPPLSDPFPRSARPTFAVACAAASNALSLRRRSVCF